VTPEERGFRVAMHALTDSELRHLHCVEVSEALGRGMITIRVHLGERQATPQAAYLDADAVRERLAEQGERAAGSQRPVRDTGV
jgi:hypothetical protein